MSFKWIETTNYVVTLWSLATTWCGQVHPSKLLAHSDGIQQFSSSDGASEMYLEVRGCLGLIPSRKLTYPPKMAFWRWFSFPKVGYVNPWRVLFDGQKSHLPRTNMPWTMGEARPIINCFFGPSTVWWKLMTRHAKHGKLTGELGSLVRLHTLISGSKIYFLKIYGFEQDLWSMVSNRIYDPLTNHVLFLDYFGICVLTSRFLIVLRWWMVIWKKAGNQLVQPDQVVTYPWTFATSWRIWVRFPIFLMKVWKQFADKIKFYYQYLDLGHHPKYIFIHTYIKYSLQLYTYSCLDEYIIIYIYLLNRYRCI